ncbi:glycosyl hydrolase [Mucilaginibacter limnophilus]|nr:glycosyl hydrolase [Mucilaginibacter limnophilus]
MFKLFIIAMLAVLSFIAVTSQPERPGKDFVWGINGHPLTQADYSDNWDKQIEAIKDLKLNSYRFDVLLNVDGEAKDDDGFTGILKKLKENHITPLPAVMQKGFKGVGFDDIYPKAYEQGKAFAAKYGEYITVLEVGNEGDNKIIKSANVDGIRAEHYDNEKARRLVTATKGFIDGLKAVQPQIKVTLSFSWIHFYYLQMLADNNVNYDIIGYHWYSNMGDITNVRKPFGNVLQLVSKRYNKPIWITEFNYFKGTTKVDFSRQNEFISKNLQHIIAQGIISGFFIYELYDQPALKRRYPTEANYGLLHKDSSGRYEKKTAYLGFRQLVARYRSVSF